MPVDPSTPARRSSAPLDAVATTTSGDRVRRVFREGFLAGLAGYAAVVVVVAALDALAGRAVFHTPGLLGSWLVFGLTDPAGFAPTPGPVLAYNGIHLLGSLAAGTMGALMVLDAELVRGFWYVGLMALVALAVVVIAVLGGAAVELGQAVDWGSVVLGTTAWLTAMTAYFWSAHRRDAARIEASLRSAR